ncbi:MAG TPA: N-acetyltransferase [Sedimentisphaerales bacterium]|nr:N-acetyltransferase [Sedimentisphaerales bacterium]
MNIRDEKPSDIEVITEITIVAFADCQYGNHSEQFIIHALRDAGALTVSLVAEIDGRIVGHIAFSPVTISGLNCQWYGMGPVSVRPDCQRQGIGKSLIEQGLTRLKKSGARGCVLVGDPGYYERFGFRNLPELILEGVPPKYFLGLPFGEDRPQGIVVFHEGFSAAG